MREILFRGKRVDNGEWIEGNLIQYPLSSYSYIMSNYGFDDEICVRSETVGQFTGLLDKKGKKIFEGDIVRRFNSKKQEVMRYAVKWNTDCCMFVLMSEYTYLGEYDSDFTVFYGEEFEIVGNIYDNPELLKDDDILSEKLKEFYEKKKAITERLRKDNEDFKK